MKAWRVHDWTEPRGLAIEQVDPPEPGRGEIRVRVDTAALNFFDGLMIAGKYQVKPERPFTPGCEFAGTVEATGPGARFAVGSRICGQPGWGAFAESCIIRDSQAFEVPADVPLDEAAAIPVTYGTAHIALRRRGRIEAGETVLVTAAAGGVGLATVQLAKAWGAKVIALAGSDEKRRIVTENGADLALDYGGEDWVDAVRDFTGGRGVDIIVDPVGGKTYDLALKVIANEGRAVIIGFAGGSIQSIASNRLLLKNASAVGAIWGRYLAQDPELVQTVIADVFDLHRKGAVRPAVWKTYPFDDLPAALEALGSRRTWGKVLLSIA